MDDAQSLAAFTAHCFPEPARVLDGLAALYINALEHGILGIGIDNKAVLIEQKKWRQEIERRQSLPEHTDRFVDITISRKENGIYVIVDDHGSGFNWQRYIQIDATRASDINGRGIALAVATSFDKLTYNEVGNQAVAYVAYKHQELDW